MSTTTTFTKSELVRYAAAFAAYEVAKYKLSRETDTRIKPILEQDVQREYDKLIAIRETLGLQ